MAVPTRRIASVALLLAGCGCLLWVADLAQLAKRTSEPQLIEFQVILFGVPAALIWALGTWASLNSSAGSRRARVVVGIVAALPWLVLILSAVDVLRFVCARPGGACG